MHVQLTSLAHVSVLQLRDTIRRVTATHQPAGSHGEVRDSTSGERGETAYEVRPSTVDSSGRQALSSTVSHWTFDDAIGRISARDAQGNTVMAIATGPLFAARLAAAFSSPDTIGTARSTGGLRPPAFPT